MAETNQSQTGGMFDNKNGAQSAPAQQPQQNVPVVQKDVVDSVLAKITKFEETGELKLPANYSAANALKSAWLILQETKDRSDRLALTVCTKESIANALLDMVVQGLSPMKKQCYFIVYGNKLTLQRSYLGTLAIAKRVGGVLTAVANCVYEGDEFIFSVDPHTGLKKIVKHEQTLETLDASKVKGAYAILTTEDGRNIVEIMNISQIKQAWMQGATKGGSPAHKNFGDEMAKKTVIGRACKVLIGMSDDSALFDEPDDTEIDTTAGHRAAQIEGAANKKHLGEVEDVKFEEVKPAAPAQKPSPAPSPAQQANATDDNPPY
ncbi:recombinase RecT [Bacteroides caccae]|uniref:recombinase RecT n=1 Tax=Bacteroides caccae TaxID=47678 RepID=UPI0022AAA40D|nr:RecT family recombinase [Bacteroides caccae]MCZ2726254.1 recombinase RecT [Bacteroides caccae]